MKVMVTSIVIGSFGTILKKLVKRQENLEIREQIETIQTKLDQNTDESPGDLLSLKL